MCRLIQILLPLLIFWPGFRLFQATAAETVLSTADGMSHDRIVGLCQDERGVIWICTWYGIDRYDGYEFSIFHPKENRDGYSRFKKAYLLNDSIFISTASGKNLVFSLATLAYSPYEGEIPKESLRCGLNLTDRAGNRWTGGREGVALSHSIPENYRLLTNPDFPYVRALYEDSKGRLWVAWCSNRDEDDDDGMVVAYNSNGQPTGTEIRGEAVYSIFEDEAHNMWFGTRGRGLVILCASDNKEYSYSHTVESHSLSHDKVFDIMGDSAGRIWIATLGGGVNVVDSGYDVSRLSFSVPPSYPLATHPRARSLAECGDFLLIGTEKGLLKCRTIPGSEDFAFETVGVEKGMAGPAEELIHLTKTDAGRILISSFGKGIWEYEVDADRFSPVTADDIAQKQPVYSVLPLTDGSMWVVARSNLLLYDNDRRSYITPIEQTYTMLETRPLNDSKGKSWFAAKEGLLCVDNPDSVLHSSVAAYPKVIFTKLNIHHSDSIETRILSFTDSILTIAPDQRNSSLSLSAVNYGNTDRIKYYWRFSDKDTVWAEIAEGNTLPLSGLPQGEWIIEVRSTDIYGRQLDNAGHIRVRIEPLWYEMTGVRWLGKLIIILGIGLLVWLLVKYRRLQTIYATLLNSQPVAIMSAAMTEIKDTDEFSESDREFLDSVNARIEASLSDSEFSIDALVESLGMSRSVFYRKLKSAAGQSPSEYINQYRLRRAAAMLRDDRDKTVAAVAYECGFSSPQYFSNLFRKRYQMTPNEWRKNPV